MPPDGSGIARGRSAGLGSPTKPSPKPPGLSSVLERNIATLNARREREEAEATLQARVADAITRFTGSMPFVYIHLVVYGFWIIAKDTRTNKGFMWDVARVERWCSSTPDGTRRPGC